jgi:hypothetical protein
MLRYSMTITLLVILTSGCAVPPKATITQDVTESAEVPFQNTLVLVLFSKFDTRRYLEDEIVKHLDAQGIKAVASTSMMTTKTPLTRDFILETMTELGSDSLLLTQLANLETTGEVKSMNPEVTYNVRPTYYVNVFTVDQQEFIEPQTVRFTHYLSTSSDLYSFKTKEKIWGMITYSKIKQNVDNMREYSIIVDEANAIVNSMLDDAVVSN